MSTTEQATEPVEGVTPFSRTATGLVRELPLVDVMTFNASAATPLTVVLAISLFSVLAAFPGANLVVTLPLAVLGALFLWITYSLMGAAMPRVGGDYLFVSRTVHPAVGLASNACAVCAGLSGAGFVAYAGVTLGLIPGLQIVGALSGGDWWTNAAATLGHQGWTFAIAAAAVIGTGVLAAYGTKLVGRSMTYLYLVAFVGGIVTIIVIALTSRGSFVSHLNVFSQPLAKTADAYGDTVAAGRKAGLASPGTTGYSPANTIGALVLVYGFSSAYQWGVYLSGEMKGAGRRSRQLTSMIGAGLGQNLLLFLGLLAFIHTVGYDFLSSSVSGNYGVPVSPYPTFFVGTVTGTVLAGILSLTLLCGFLPWMYANSAMTYRAPFAWAFDGLVPRKLTTVSARHHTPTYAIAVATLACVGIVAWASFSDNFLTVIAFSFLWAYVSFALVGVAAVMMPFRHPAQYRGSSAAWKVLGLPMLPVAGAITVLWNGFMIYLGLHYHANVGIAHVSTAVFAVGGTLVVGVVYYFAAKAFQRSRGIDLDVVYRVIPPE